MEKTIRVIATGSAESRPDTIEIALDFASQSTSYSASMADNNRKANALNQGMADLGFPKTTVKTGRFSVERTTESYQDANKNYKTRFVGYTTTQEMTLRFDLDLKKLNEVLTLLAGCDIHSDFKIRFTVKDQQRLQDEILRSAAITAKRQATILAETSGCKLGELVSIDYSWSKVNVYTDTRFELNEARLMSSTVMDQDFEPEDVKASDTVTFVWMIQ
jgi:uncharacterized protein YggE